MRAFGGSVLSALGLRGFAPVAFDTAAVAQGMRRYTSTAFNFEMDIPENWTDAPPVMSNSKAEVVRFFPRVRSGPEGLVVFRSPAEPNLDLKAQAEKIQARFAQNGDRNFTHTALTIGNLPAWRMDFDKASPPICGCRHYFIAAGGYIYVLGFGTLDREVMFPVFERMARSFVVRP